MKRLSVIAIVAGALALASCGGSHSSKSASDAGEKMDSMVKQARSAIEDAADSLAHGAQNAVHGLKTTRDSGTKKDS